MANNPNYSKLPRVLSSLVLKRAAVLIRGLILAEQERDEVHPIVNYDQQCEGAHILFSLFSKKVQSIKYKGFSMLQEHQEEIPVLVNYGKICTGTTRRTNLNTTTTHSDFSPIRLARNNPTISENQLSVDEPATTPKPSPSSSRLSRLLARVKDVNSTTKGAEETFQRPSTKSHRVEAGFNGYHTVRNNGNLTSRFGASSECHQNRTMQYPSGTSSARNSRRMFILDKFNQLQNKLQLLEQGDRPGQPVQKLKFDIGALRERLHQKHNPVTVQQLA